MPLVLIFIASFAYGQEVQLPTDYRQHNVTENSSNLFNPVLSLNGSNAHTLALWSRWQWQTIDADPTSILVNYNRRFNDKLAVGIGFFQHNTGTFLQKGEIINFAYDFVFSPTVRLAVGANIYGFQQELANDVVLGDPNIQLPQLENNNQFIVQVAPGFRLAVDKFSLGFASENLLTFSRSDTDNTQKVYLGFVSYDIPFEMFNDGSSFIKPSIYLKSIPNYDSQFGLNVLASTSKAWIQTGYNNFYGISVGAGGKFFKRVSIGALVEFGTDASLVDKKSSFEIVTAINFGQNDTRKKVVGFDIEGEDEVMLKELAKVDAQKAKDSLAIIKEKELLAMQKRTDSIALVKEQVLLAESKEIEHRDSISTVKANQEKQVALIAAREKEKAVKILEQNKLDSIQSVKLAQIETEKVKAEKERLSAIAEATQKRTDSIKVVEQALAELQKETQVAPATFEENKAKTRGHYEEEVSENNQELGYYLIANVYRTKTYFEKFMKSLEAKGLSPKSFYRSVNKYNYVYLKRYNTIEEAEKARISKFNGRYAERIWIYRIK